ncbi:MAG: PaaI family thioesterase [Chloroflexota bacterium]|nr:MAG: PaaI family thioesterase [Chloroflexota bacterium]
MTRRSFQEKLNYGECWGCSPVNGQGLQIKSYWEGEEAIATFQPEPQYIAGPKHIVNGGIVATIVDCHCANTAIADSYRREGREIGSLPIIWYVTASLKVDYLCPMLIAGPVVLRARIESFSERKTIVTCDVYSQEKICASGNVLAVRVPGSWFERG